MLLPQPRLVRLSMYLSVAMPLVLDSNFQNFSTTSTATHCSRQPGGSKCALQCTRCTAMKINTSDIRFPGAFKVLKLGIVNVTFTTIDSPKIPTTSSFVDIDEREQSSSYALSQDLQANSEVDIKTAFQPKTGCRRLEWYSRAHRGCCSNPRISMARPPEYVRETALSS